MRKKKIRALPQWALTQNTSHLRIAACTWLFLSLFYPRHISSRDQKIAGQGAITSWSIPQLPTSLFEWRRHERAKALRFFDDVVADKRSFGDFDDQSAQISAFFDGEKDPDFADEPPSHAIQEVSWQIISQAIKRCHLQSSDLNVQATWQLILKFKSAESAFQMQEAVAPMPWMLLNGLLPKTSKWSPDRSIAVGVSQDLDQRAPDHAKLAIEPSPSIDSIGEPLTALGESEAIDRSAQFSAKRVLSPPGEEVVALSSPPKEVASNQRADKLLRDDHLHPPLPEVLPSSLPVSAQQLPSCALQKSDALGPLMPSAPPPRSDEMLVPLRQSRDESDQQIKSVEAWGFYRLLNPPGSINPGQSFFLRNWYQIRQDAVQIKRTLKLPLGWTAEFAPEISFAGDSANLDLIKINPPSQAAAGDYTCELTHEYMGGVGAPIALPVTVKPYTKVYLNTTPLPPALSQADPVTLKLELQNSGNAPIRLNPTYTSNIEAKIAFTPPSLYLSPGQKGQVEVQATNLLVTGMRNDWVLNLKFCSDDGSVVANTSAGCPVFKSGFTRTRSYENSLDTQLQMLYATTGGSQDLVWQWSGSGHVNAARTRKADFFLQLPSQNSNGSQDPTYKARLSLTDQNWQVDIGDTTYLLAPMVQAGFLGRGARFYTAWANKQIALFGLKERDYTANKSKVGSQIGATYAIINDTNSLNIDLLTKRRQEQSELVTLSDYQRIAGIQYKWMVGPWGRMTIFLGRNCASTPYSQERGRWAYQVGWQTPFKSLWQGSAVWTRQQPGFWGSAQDRKEVSFSFARELNNIYTSFQGFYGRDNLNNYPGRSGLITNTYSVSWRRKLFWHFNGTLSVNYRRRVDRIQLSEDDSSHGIAPGFSVASGALSIDGVLQIYRARDAIRDLKRFPKWQPQLNVNYQLMENFGLTWNGSWGSDPLQIPFSPSTTNRVGLIWNISESADVSFSSIFGNSPTQRTHSYNTSATWRPFTDHLAKLNYTTNLYPRSATKTYRFLTLNYSIFFSIPSGRSLSSDLRGQVIDESNPKSSHRYIVCLGGYKNLSDRSGRYAFTDIPAGDYPIWLENLPPGKVEISGGVTRQKLEAGKSEKRDLAISQASRISGTIQIVRDRKKIELDAAGQLVVSNSATSDETGIAGAVLSLKEAQGTTRIAAISDKDGNFDFGQVHPGKWVVEVVEIDLPENFCLETSKIDEIDVAPNEPVNLTWRAVAQKRQIKMIN